MTIVIMYQNAHSAAGILRKKWNFFTFSTFLVVILQKQHDMLKLHGEEFEEQNLNRYFI